MKTAGVLSGCVVLLLLPCGVLARDQQRSAQLSKVPLAAQSSISAALGRDLPDYYARGTGDSFEAANPSQGLATHFDSAGVEVRSGNLRWKLAFDGYGYGDTLHAAIVTSPHAAFNRIEYQRGSVTEWYVNGPAGVEQGFTLSQPPDRDDHRPLTIALQFSGDMAMRLGRRRTDLTLIAPRGGTELHYSGLAAYDAAGRRLPAWLEIHSSRLLLRVDPVGARYPLTIDPLVQAKLTPKDGAANDKFGTSMAVSGNTVVVGSPGKGAVYVFVKPPNGWANMTQTAKLTASAGEGPLGPSVAISGSTIVAGAPFATVLGRAQQGVAYVFVRPPGGWHDMTQTAKLTASDGASQARLGQGVGIYGNTIVAGAYGAIIGGNSFQGAAYVFVKPGPSWVDMTQTAKLTASDGAASNFLGISVSVSGATVVAGASGQTIGGNMNQGATYVFAESPNGWADMTQTAKLTASDGAARDQLGNAVAIDGNTIVAGAIGSNQVKGAAYIFVAPGNAWTDMTETAKLTARDGVGSDNFATSVSISGKVVVLGAPTAQIGSNPHQGATYAFVRPSGGWRTTKNFNLKVTASDGASGDYFGFSVGISGTTAGVGAAFAQGFQGTGYVFSQ